MAGRLAHRLLKPFVELREGEGPTLLLMFAYSFLAMAGYNVVKPATRSQFINSLGSANLPYVLLATGLLMGFVIQGYNRGMALLPRRLVFPVTQLVMVGLLVLFWALFQTGGKWVPVGFYFWGALAGSLLISQFWTLANDIFDPRQAKRVFGFIGGGSSLGGIVGAGLAGRLAKPIGTNNLLLIGAAFLAVCFFIVVGAVGRLRAVQTPAAQPGQPDEKGMSLVEAARLLVQSKHFQIIAIVISFASIGAGIIDQQLNMAVESLIPDRNDRTRFIADVTFYASVVGFLVQVTLTSRLHRMLGIGFALLILPVSLGSSGLLMLLVPALWSSSLARVADTALRYTADKTTREILYMPLPTELKYKAKPFADVAVDRLARGVGTGLALIIAIKVFHLTWWQLSYLSVPIAGFWVLMAIRARREYLEAFRKSIETREVAPADLRPTLADLSTIETLVEELANPDAKRVLYAIDLLESLEKRNLITPLLLRHESPEVRIRALGALGSMRVGKQWTPSVERMLKDDSADVRAAAVRALAALHKESVGALMRPHLDDLDPRIAATAAMALADSGHEADVRAAEATFRRLAEDTREAATPGRREAAAALARVKNPDFRLLLVPLMHDAGLDVARQAIQSARAMGTVDTLIVPGLVALLGHRVLKHAAREVLVSYGDGVLDALAYFLKDQEEHVWVRRHIPATLARLPSQRSMDILLEALEDPDGFLRYKVVAAIEKLRRDHPELAVSRAPVEALVLKEGSRYYNALTLRSNIVRHDTRARQSLLVRALDDKLVRALDRIYRLLGLIYPWKDVASARYTIEHGKGRVRAGAVEYMDNLLGGAVRKRVMPIIEDSSADENVRAANAVLKGRPRDLEDTLAQLVHEDDPVVAAAAIHFVEERQLWALADDLEYALEHRPVADWYVFEAASWALAARRVSEKRRDLWLEPLPAVELADRLRAIPLFDFVSVDELFRIGGAGRQIRHEAGRELYHAGTQAGEVQFLLDGSVQLSAGDGVPTDGAAPMALAFEEMLEGSPLRHTVRAVDRAICLALSGDEFLTMLSDNIVLAQGLFRMLLDTPKARQWRLVYTPRPGAAVPPRSQRLQPLEKVLLLRQNPLLERATVNQLLDLAAVAREVPLTAGRVLFTETDTPAVYHVLQGEVRLEADAADPIMAGPGSTIGMSETLAGVSLGRRAAVTREGQALRLDHDELFDVLADHIDLVQGLFSALLRTDQAEVVIDGPATSAPAKS